MDRKHDVITVICGASVIWCPRSEVLGMDLKHVYFRNSSQCYVQFGSRWLGEMVRSCVNTWFGVIGNVEILKANFIIQSRQKPIWQYQWRHMETTELPLPHFCWFHANNNDMKIIMLYACERVWSSIATAAVPGRDWCASDIWKIEFSKNEFNNIFPMVYDTNQALTKWQMKVPKAKSEWGHQYI